MHWAFLILMVLLIIVQLDAKKRIPRASDLDEEVTEVKYSNEAEKAAYIEHLKKKRTQESLDDNLSDKERAKLIKSEQSLKKNLLRVTLDKGKHSRERAAALHALGGNIYKQGRYTELLALSQEIVGIHEVLDGVESEETAKALGNVGSVANRLENWRLCELVMKRALYILIKNYGLESKEVLLHRGKMLTFRVPDAEKTEGLSHGDYEGELFYDEL